MPTSLVINGLTPALIGAGLSFDVDTVLEAWDDPAKPGAAKYNAARVATDALPHTSPIYHYETDVEGIEALVGLEVVTLTVNGLTPAIIGSGLNLNITSSEVGSARFLATLEETMETEIHLLTEAAVYTSDADRTDDEDAIDRDTKRYSDLPGTYTLTDALTFGLDSVTASDMPVVFDIARQTDGYPSAAARTTADASTRRITSLWNPNTNPAPYNAPVTRPNDADALAGTLPMLTEDPVGDGMVFTLKAAGSEEGLEDSTRIVRGSWQPLSVKETSDYATITKGSQAYWLRTDLTADLKDAQSNTPDRIAFGGQDYEVALVEKWDNAVIPHLKALCVSLKPFVSPQ